MRASRRFWGKDWRGFFPQQWVSPPQGFNTLCSQEWRCTARPAFPQNHGFTLCKLTHSRLLAGGSFSGTRCASRKQAFLRQKMLGNKLASLARDKRITGRRLLRTNTLFRKKLKKVSLFALKMRGRKLALQALAQPINNPSPHQDLSHDPLGFLNYPRPPGLGLFSTKPWIYPLQGFNPCPR